MRLVFDIEANGLYYEASLIHCLVAKDIDNGTVYKFEPSKVEQGLKLLMTADVLIGHNVIGYDLAVIKKLHPWFDIPRERVIDTLVLSRLLYSNLSDKDHADKVLKEGKLYGSHSLKAWGQRLGEYKGDYEGGFIEFTEEMLAYNEQDVVVTERLYDLLSKHKAYSERASVLEHQVAHIVAQQERHGFVFDVKAAEKLNATLMIRQGELAQKLQDTFAPWEEEIGEFIPKVNNKKLGYVKGVPIIKTKIVVFNPGSRHHIANRLKALHGWKPKEFTMDGSAKIDESVLSKLKYPEAELLNEYFLIQKRLGLLAEGQNAWLKMVKANSRIHGEVITNGAITSRATHRNPNLAQCPSVSKRKDGSIKLGSEGGYGYECRSLFTVPAGKRLVGVDVSGLELRMLAHFMGDPDYAREVIDGDIHTVNMHAAGLDTRDQAKTFIYAFLFGGGNERLGSIVGKGASHGKELKERFLRRIPSLEKLLKAVKQASVKGYLIGLDGRHLHIRSDHAALNVLLQASGSLCCKQWMVEVDKMLTEMNWHDKVKQVVWVHDECQYECDPHIAELAGKKIVECIAKAGEFFNLSIPLTGEFKIGSNWAETH
jgi:DNA polymerase I-like protein with 3'-5' exonuclease and polymerase domains